MVLFRLHVLSEIFCLLLFSVDTLEEVLIEESSSIESVHALRDGSVELPCDVTPAIADDSMALVIWYKQGHDAPIYSLDSRDGVTSHWSDPATFSLRATFRSNTTPAVLIITRLSSTTNTRVNLLSLASTALAGSRIFASKLKTAASTDVEWTLPSLPPRTPTRLNLTVLIPPERLMIFNQEGDEVRGRVLGPYDEHTNVTLTCLAIGGRPPARVSWWKSHALLANSETRATVSFQLTRSDYGANITCQAVTDPALAPLSETLSIDMNPLAPVAVKLSPVLLLVLCAGAVLVTVTVLVAILMCTRYYKRHDDKEKMKRKQDVTSNKPLTQYEDYENDRNPDIIPIESKISDTCSNISSTTDHSSVRPLLSRTNVDKYDEPVNYERYYDHYECNLHMQERPKDYRRQYQPNLEMHIPSVPNIRPNLQSAGPCEKHIHNMRSEKYQMSHDVLYEDWLKYKNSLPHNTGLQFLAPSALPPQSLYAQPRPLRFMDMPDPNYRIELHTDAPLSADTTVYYSRSPHELENTLPPPTQPVSATTKFTNTTSDK